MYSLEHIKVGDSVSRITPPRNGQAGYMQSGRVIQVTEDEIFVSILVDVYRTMVFSRKDGTEPKYNFGSFIVPRDELVATD